MGVQRGLGETLLVMLQSCLKSCKNQGNNLKSCETKRNTRKACQTEEGTQSTCWGWRGGSCNIVEPPYRAGGGRAPRDRAAGKGGRSPSAGEGGDFAGLSTPRASSCAGDRAGTAAEPSAEQQWALVVEPSNCTAQAPPGLRLPRPAPASAGTGSSWKAPLEEPARPPR